VEGAGATGIYRAKNDVGLSKPRGAHDWVRKQGLAEHGLGDFWVFDNFGEIWWAEMMKKACFLSEKWCRAFYYQRK
jgi:hypothetical protein